MQIFLLISCAFVSLSSFVIASPVFDRELPEFLENIPDTPHFSETAVFRRITRDDDEDDRKPYRRRRSTSSSTAAGRSFFVSLQVRPNDATPSCATTKINGQSKSSCNNSNEIIQSSAGSIPDDSSATEQFDESVVDPMSSKFGNLSNDIITRKRALDIIKTADLEQLEAFANHMSLSGAAIPKILIDICRYGRAEMVKFWLKKFDVSTDQDIQTVLSVTVQENHFTIIPILKAHLGHRFTIPMIHDAIKTAIAGECNASLLTILELFSFSRQEIEDFADMFVERKIQRMLTME